MQNPMAQFFIDFMQEYREAWNNLDVEKIVDSYHTPCFIFKNGQVYSNTAQEAKIQYFTDLLADYRAQ